jgi:hypothetical protein
MKLLILLLLVVGASCSKQLPPCKTPTADYVGGWCAGGTRKGKDFVICSPSESLCKTIVDKARIYNDVAGLGLEAISDCAIADVTLTVKDV